jgi:hypothetical protein
MKMKKIYSFFVVATIVLFASCTPSSYELGNVDVTSADLVEGKAFTITPDATNPNIIILKSNMTGYTPLWIHPQGLSQSDEVTLKIAFPGTYSVVFGVETRGGVVYGDTCKFTVNKMCTDFISDERWNLLAGGVGKSKSWVLDLDASGTCRYFSGPLFFYGTDDWYGNVSLGQAAVDYNKDGKVDSWSWCPDWPSNSSWLFGKLGALNYGMMTFDLIDGANVKVQHAKETFNKTETGTYLIDTSLMTLSLTNAQIPHDLEHDAIVSKWNALRILSITENTLQLGVLRDKSTTEGPCLLVYNFISKDYADSH